ncbi:MAG: hypothetical protein N2170_00940 [Bacteroidia bacterium]|nr:hypothetical protein [Bacteroidia bacterium]
MGELAIDTLSLPPVYYRWLQVVRRFPMFDVRRAGILCSIRLSYILEPTQGAKDIFLHRQRLGGLFPPPYLPLGYDVFGNILLWDLESGVVYLHWRGASPSCQVKVAPSLEDLCDKLYYRPIH